MTPPRPSSRPRRVLVAVVVGLGLLLAACAKHAPQTTLKPQGPEGTKINNLFNGVFWVAVVIHSFWVPALGGKHDVEPGRVSRITYQAAHPGTYLGQCVEFCGLSHANMRLRAFAQSPSDFDKWVSDQKTAAATPPSGTQA